MATFKDKFSWRQSSLTTWREREPTNPRMSSMVQTMVFDFSEGKPLWPNSDNKTLIERTHNSIGTSGYARINKTTHSPFALNKSVVGGKTVLPVHDFIPGTSRSKTVKARKQR